TEFSTWVGLHQGLYAQYMRLSNGVSYAALSRVRQRIVDMALRDFRLGGVELEGEARRQYAQISDQQAQLSQKFSENVLDALDGWSCLVDEESRLASIPEDVKNAARELAKQTGATGWM